ncbi:hypothetical protein [Corynebacterium ulcerans]|uniref:Uncharacterized protein n=1 Tax=Corynebacterium ulcerans TaxID=65058 RepID=A0ABD7MT16_CORUL|nr:hypothetical protein [Corynebacterium ulcerans]MBH5298509.1 hypothetical protein [Corynebacterium ulcerans]QQU25927.1 hypothetical protein I6I75_00960 [Corynebacterium ulcerans]SNV13616.1 Uncharacterised protein [Corynebacterium ulcerans]SQG51362.1 Uncharacterised protein [Corynebacterium ulcerans]SQH02367.1 Uncharacterised protein [Corynebacterium ulcerans]
MAHQELVELRKEHNASTKLLGEQQPKIASLQEELAQTHSKLNEAVMQIPQLQVDEANSFVWEIRHRDGHEYYLTNRSNRPAFNIQLKSDSPKFQDVFTTAKLLSGNSMVFNYVAAMGSGDYVVYFAWQDETGGDFVSEQVRFDKNLASTFRFHGVPNYTEDEG